VSDLSRLYPDDVGGRSATTADPAEYPASGTKPALYCPFPGATVKGSSLVLRCTGTATAPERTTFRVDGRTVGTTATSNAGVVTLDVTELADGPHELLITTLDGGSGSPVAASVTRLEFTTARSVSTASYTVPQSPTRFTGKMPHFAKDGSGVLAEYDATKSRYVIAPYLLTGAEVAAAGGPEDFEAVGINAVTHGFLALAWVYGGGYSLAAYTALADPYSDAIAATVPDGWSVLAVADDFCPDGGNTLTVIDFVNGIGVVDWGAAYWTHAVERLATYGNVAALIVGDEVGDASRYPNVPKSGNAGLKSIADIARSTTIPVAYQLAMHPYTSDPAGWVETYAGDDYSDASCVITNSVDGEDRAYDDLCKQRGVYQARLVARFAATLAPTDRPRICQVGVTGPDFFREGTSAETYRPGVDRLNVGPWTPEAMLCQIGVYAIYGYCCRRDYSYDDTNTVAAREAAVPGGAVEIVIGLSELKRALAWEVYGLANNLIHELFERLCQAPASRPAFGSDWEVGAWDGGSGKKLVLAVNGTDCRRAIPAVPSGSWAGGCVLTVDGRTDGAPAAGTVVAAGGWAVWTA
jgi:hypothetical protein